MSFRISNVVASIPVASVNTQTVTSTSVTTSTIAEQSAGAGVRINDVVVHGNVVYAGGVSLKNTVSDKSVTLTAPSTLPADYQLSMPQSDGTGGQLLGTDGANHLQWVTVAGGSTDFLDTDFRVSHATGGKIKLDAVNIPAGQVRTITMPNSDVNLSTVPNQTLNTTSSPTFVGVTASTVSTDAISEKTALAGVSISSNSKKCMQVTPGVVTTYDSAEKVTETKHTRIGSVASGAAVAVTMCTISLTVGSACYVDFSITAQNGTAYETYNSFKLLVNNATLAVTNIVDITKHENWSYTTSGSDYSIQLVRAVGNSKPYCAIVKVQPVTDTSSYTVTWFNP